MNTMLELKQKDKPRVSTVKHPKIMAMPTRLPVVENWLDGTLLKFKRAPYSIMIPERSTNYMCNIEKTMAWNLISLHYYNSMQNYTKKVL